MTHKPGNGDWLRIQSVYCTVIYKEDHGTDAFASFSHRKGFRDFKFDLSYSASSKIHLEQPMRKTDGITIKEKHRNMVLV